VSLTCLVRNSLLAQSAISQPRREDTPPDSPDMEGRTPPGKMAKGMEGMSGRDAGLVGPLSLSGPDDAVLMDARSEYMLWTDELSRNFVEAHYPAFLHMFDSYKYPIQRADSIRYFILNHFGGIYMDLDIGCRRRMDSLLQGDWEVVLPITKPVSQAFGWRNEKLINVQVGVSNDLIFSTKRSAFMEDTVHALPAFDHEWFSNYPTVMFSTG